MSVPGALPAEHRGRGLQSQCCCVWCARAGVRVASPEAKVLTVRPVVADVAGRALAAFSVPPLLTALPGPHTRASFPG